MLQIIGDMSMSARMVPFLSDPGVPGPIYGSSCLKLRDVCADLTDVTLADEDTNSILADNANRAIQGNVAMQIIQSGCQL